MKTLPSLAFTKWVEECNLVTMRYQYIALKQKRVLSERSELLEAVNDVIYERVKQERQTSDEAIILSIQSLANHEISYGQSLSPAQVAARPNQDKFRYSRAAAERLLGIIKDRPLLTARIHFSQAEFTQVAGRDVNTAKEYTAVRDSLSGLRADADLLYQKATLAQGYDALIRGDKKQADDYIFDAKGYPWVRVNEAKTKAELLQIYTSACGGLISARRGDLAALQRIFIYPAAGEEVQRALRNAIRDAEGLGEEEEAGGTANGKPGGN